MHPDAAVVFDKPEFAKAIHEEADAGPRGADHLRQRLLCYGRNKGFRISRLAILRHQQENSCQTLLTGIETEADLGRFGEVRRLIQQAVQLSRSLHEQERAANWTAQGALFESEVGNRSRATEQADSALRLSHEKDIRVLAALALARAGDSKRAEMLAAGLRLEFPLDTILNRYWLPVIEAAVQLSKGDSYSALEHLEIAKPYELGQPSSFQVLAISPMIPVYLRGESFLAAGKGAEATTEFEGMLRRPGLALNYPLEHLARLGLARAAALRGETSKAARLYGEFLLAWGNADSDLPLLKQARNEATNLKGRN